MRPIPGVLVSPFSTTGRGDQRSLSCVDPPGNVFQPDQVAAKAAKRVSWIDLPGPT